MSQKLGFIAEEIACDYLKKQGLIWCVSNYRCRVGEIDLIMQHREYIVFIEVRSRQKTTYGSALESITYHKQQKLLKTASYYLLSNKLLEKQPSRFDVVSLDGTPPKIQWIQNAFGAYV